MNVFKPKASHARVGDFRVFSREDVIRMSKEVLSRPDIPGKQNEDIWTMDVAGLEWDVAVMVYEPTDPSKIPVGADGKKIGIYLLHGGSGDYKSMEPQAKLLVAKFGYKVISGTYPGRLYLDSPNRDWPDDTINPDGTVRTPLYKRGERIGREQYEVVKDDSKRARYGTRTVARAKPGSLFYDRMAAWPLVTERMGIESMQRHFPEKEFSIYIHGHSTGGPQICMLAQRVPNIQGLVAIENSSFGYINEAKHNWSGALGKVKGFKKVASKPDPRTDPFEELYIRTWRDRARYAGPEALGQEGPNALMRLPWLMEEILENWARDKRRAQFKCEYLITHNVVNSLEDGARVTAKRLGLSSKETEALVGHYIGMTRELQGSDVKRVPNVLFGISLNSRDHSPDVYEEVILPRWSAMSPAPLVTVTQFGAGVHRYMTAEEDLPSGIAPAVFTTWDEAIKGGYFLQT
jgi:hypothetical protein